MSNQDISVIICAYTEKRWDDLVAAVASIQAQSILPLEIILVIDHNDILLRRARDTFPGVCVTENRGERGLSGARNSGIALAQGEIIAFMDEDAMAAPDWLALLQDGFRDQNVLGVGGAIIPQWFRGEPQWFPDEFNWVVGCTYRGMPTEASPVRNLIGCNMSFRREIFEDNLGFRDGIGRIGLRPLGCEETELCIRVGRIEADSYFLYDPRAIVEHRVPQARKSFRYFLSRCYSEGLSKAQVSRLVGTDKGLASERKYTFRTLPAGVFRGFRDLIDERDLAGLQRSAAIVIGLASTTIGYFWGNLAARIKPQNDDSQVVQTLDKASANLPPGMDGFDPIRILEVELNQPILGIQEHVAANGEVYRRARSLVRLHKQPLGVIDLELEQGCLSSEKYADRIWKVFRGEINRHLHQDGLPEIKQLDSAGLKYPDAPKCEQERRNLLTEAPPASIVIATHDRPESLASTLDTLFALDYPNFEIIVVDNAPSTNATYDLMRNSDQVYGRIRYVREDRPGLAVAHNRGLSEVKAPFVVFTDDDVLVDKSWLSEIVAGFGVAQEVACVTGAILPVEIETLSQDWIESLWGLSKGFERTAYQISDEHPRWSLFPYTAGQFGSGANMAFRTSVLREVGGFDPALGAGSKALGGDDLAAFFRIVKSGYTLVYQPSAIVYHHHRRSYDALRRLVYGYGVGLTAYLTGALIDSPGRIFDLLSKTPSGIKYALGLRAQRDKNKDKDYPRELTTMERKGMLHGPFAYLRSRWHTRGLPRLDSKKRATFDSASSISWADDASS